MKFNIIALLLLSLSALAVGAEPPTRDCAECNKSGNSRFRYEGRDNVIGLLINDMIANENKLKPADQIEKYHSCLLSGKTERSQSRSYEEKYRFLIAVANESFNVPLALLTCLCGRESRFDAQSASDDSSAVGVCQSLSDSLSDVKKWITVNPDLRSAWEGYIGRLGRRLEHADCAKRPLSPELLVRCPSLGFGVASVYLTYVHSRVEKNSSFANNHWDTQGINTLVAVAGSYFVGPGFADKAFRTRNRARWPAALMESQCEYAKKNSKGQDWVTERLSALRNHMVSVRNCMQADNWLDHQGKPMGGECENPNHGQKLRDLATFRASLPMSCRIQ